MEESIVFRFFLYIITAYIMFSPVAIYNLCKLRKIKQEAARRITPSNSDLWFDLLGAQKELKIPEQYRLEATDRTVVVKIIEDYKKKLTESYFEERFHPPKTRGQHTTEIYFMISFYDYLKNTYISYSGVYMRLRVFDIYNNIYDLQETIEQNEMDGTFLYSSRSKSEIIDCRIKREKDFEALCCKLFYIVYLYCCNCPIANPSLWDDWERNVKNFLLFELEKRTS